MRLLAALIAVVFVLGLAACGGADTSEVAEPAAGDPTNTPYVSLSETQAVIERVAGVEVVRTGIAAAAADVDEPAASARFEVPRTDEEFDVLVLPNPAALREALPKVEGQTVAAVNVIAVFDRASAAQQRIRAAFDQLEVACKEPGRQDVAETIDMACRRGGDQETLDAPEQEAVREGGRAVLDGVAYRVVLARQLNPAIEPDEALVGGVDVPAGRALFGVFLQACAVDGPATPDARIRLVTALGRDFRPLRERVPSTLRFEPRPLEDGECVPEVGSVAERSFDGAPLVFRVGLDAFEDRPLSLALTDGADDTRLALDL